MSWYFLHRSNIAQRDDFPKIVLKETRSLPIYPVNLSNAKDKVKYEQMISYVETILTSQSKLLKVNSEQEKLNHQRQIEATDRQIDALVYQLYGLTEEEI